MKRILATLLTLALLAGLLPTALAADAASSPSPQTLTAEELPGTPRLDGLTPTEENTQRPSPAYAPEDLVTVIVELEDAPLLEGFTPSDGNQLAGQAVADYLASDEAVAAGNAIAQQQNALINQIAAKTRSAGQLSVVAQWNKLLNGMAVQVPYGQLDAIRGMDGVKRAYVEHVYDRPVTEAGNISEEGWYGYSYDMVGLQQAWDAGFTGKGMLVAVLDTGLDLTYATWGSMEDQQQGIRRVHEAFTDSSFRSDPNSAENGWTLRYTDESLRLFLNTNQINANTGFEGEKVTFAKNGLYKNLKVPFAWDYADSDINVQPTESDHGTHVSGTIAGYAETEEGAVTFTGVAPDAQLMMMKVFPDTADSGAPESVTINALEDALTLGADVINLSLGSDNGYANDDTAQHDLYQRIEEAGIMLMTSAGNSGFSTSGNNYNGYNTTDNPEINMMSAPAVYATNLAVASINNTVTAQSVLIWTDAAGQTHKAAFYDPNGIAMKYKFAGKDPVQLIAVDGYGTYQDYANAGFNNGYNNGKTGVALVKRGGGISFADKINNALSFAGTNHAGESYGVLAVLVYDEDPNGTELINMSVAGTSLTSAFVGGKDGAAIVAAIEAAGENKVTMTVQKEDDLLPADPVMSSFSSWGTGPSLELKPEITAPGGNIWSSIIDPGFKPADPSGAYDDYVGSYGMMSGTSMAAPHMTGLAALVEQYVREKLNVTSKAASGTLVNQLLVSTALPQSDDTTYYSPRLQGAGLVNIASALSTPAYISVDGQNVGKLEFKDDPDKTGAYPLNFNVHNLTKDTLTYDAKVVVLRPNTDVFDSEWGQRDIMLDSDVLLKEVSLGKVTVPALGTAKVKKTLQLTAEEKAELDQLFENGTYVEGFIILTDASESGNPQIGLPFLGFYGDWTAAPIFDSAYWFDAAEDGENFMNNEATWGISVVGSYVVNPYDGSVIDIINVGQNVFDGTSGASQPIYRQENFTISPNGDGYYEAIDDFILYQLRDSKVMVVEVKDKNTGTLYFRDYATYQFKTLYNGSLAAPVPSSVMYFTRNSWTGTDLDGNVLPSGTECVMSITAYGDGDYGELVWNDEAGRLVTDVEAVVPGENEPTFNGHPIDKTGDVISFDIMVDTVAPKLENNAVTIYEENGRTYIKGTVHDDGSIASVEVHPLVARTYTEQSHGDPNYIEYGIDQLNPFYSEHIYDADTKTWTFVADVTEYAHTNESYPGESNTYNYTWTGNVYVSMGDYGLNDRTYAVAVDTTDGLVLSQTSAMMHPGETFELSVNDNTGLTDSQLTRTSSNPEVATVDEFGLVKALGPGQTYITVSASDGSSAVCVVAVDEYPTEVEDFKLSIESFQGLKPNGTIVVKVTDLKPANVVLTSKRWVVLEDDPDLYVGLVTVGQHSSDGLTGEIYLNYSATGDPDIYVPGASGTLTVTLNGVSRSLHFDWEDLYAENTQDDLVSALNFNEQTVFVNQGETATLMAKYNDTYGHSVNDVLLVSQNGDEAENHLILDGPDFCTGQSWTATLVNEAGYALPEGIRVFYRYDGGYEYEVTNSWRTEFEYDKETGTVTVFYLPTGTAKLVIKADGVESPGAPAGTLSGNTYEKPEPIFGPFLWEVTSGTGTLTTAEGVEVNGTKVNAAFYEPKEPGVSYIKATTKDGAYSVNFAVISEPVKATQVSLSESKLTLEIGQTKTLTPTLSPIPSLEQHKGVIWKSFNPEVATVDENGTITAVSLGYAYLQVSSAANENVWTNCLVQVVPITCPDGHTEEIRNQKDATCTEDGYSGDVYCSVCGELLREGQVLPATGHTEEVRGRVEATCTEDGYTGDVYCSVCGEKLRSGEVIPATEHQWSQWTETQAPDCTHAGREERTCSVCNEKETRPIPALGHDYKDTIVPPTCTEEGYTQHACQRCDYTYRDSFVPALGHDYKSVVTAPTCTEEGYTTYTCTRCDDTYVADRVPALGHTWGEWTVTKPADCFHDGEEVRTCSVCGEKETRAIPKNSESCPSEQFVDVNPELWYHQGVDYVLQTGLMIGTGKTTFSPNGLLTRGQLMTILYRLAGEPAVTEPAPFTDVDAGAYYAEAIAWAYEAGIAKGVSQSKFAPKQSVSREQLVTFFARYTIWSGHTVEAEGDLSGYADGANVSAYAKEAMIWAVESGLIDGTDGNALAPRNVATRAQAATILLRYCTVLEFTPAE